jgi:hypothetical protein
MLFSKKTNIEDFIISFLLISKSTAKQLLSEILKNQEYYTIQALYVVLRDLLAQEVIYKQGTKYLINKEWRQNVIQKLEQQKNIEITEGERFIYILSSLEHHDIQWKNIVLPLHEKYNKDPIFFYNYHYIWIHLGETRQKSEINYYQSFTKDKRFAFSLIGSNSPLEIATKKIIESEYVRIYVDNIPINKSGYIAILNDYIITTQLSKKTIQEIENCYKTAKNIDQLSKKIQKINFQTRKIKLIIERNKEKAKKLRKKIGKDFYIPRELREEFDLF